MRILRSKPRIALFCLLSVLARPSRAAVFFVTDSFDPGSLRTDITNSNLAGGANTISWAAGSGGTITLLSDLPTINGNTTLDVTNAPSAVTIAGSVVSSSIPISGVVSFNNNTVAQPWTISTDIIGSGALNQIGPGTLILSGLNTYAGGTTVSSGTLVISGQPFANADAALGASAGSLTLSSGAIVQNGTGLWVSGRNINLQGQGGALDLNGGITALGGVISGAGGLTINDSIGTGILLLASTNTYTGGTSLNAGTVAIIDNSSLGTSTVVFSGGVLENLAKVTLSNAFTLNAGGGTITPLAGSNFTLSGVISGPGAITINGSGTLTLTGINTYSGGTNINAGVLNITNNSAMGTGTVSMGGGELQFGTNLSVSNPITLVSVSTIDSQGFNSTMSGLISGAGGLVKVGAGTLMLTAPNTYAGGTTVNAGTLILTGNNTFSGGATVNGGTLSLNGPNAYTGGTTINGGTVVLGANDSLPAGGALTINNGGTFDLGGFSQAVVNIGTVINNGFINARTGTLNLNNGYSGSGALGLALQPAMPNFANFTGTNMNITGQTLVVGLVNGNVVSGSTFTPIQVSGAITGQFNNPIISPAAILLTPTYTGNSVELLLTFVPYVNSAMTPNEIAVATVLDSLRLSATGDFATVISNLNTLTTSQLAAAFDQIGPISLAAIGGLGLSGYSVQTAAVNQRMTALADGSAHEGVSSYMVNNKSQFPGQLLASAGFDEMGDWKPGTWSLGPESPWGFFASADVNDGKLLNASSSNGEQPGYSFTTGGLTGGADYRFNDHFVAGLAGGYLHGHADILLPADGTVDNQSARGGVYATGFNEDFRANIYVGGAMDFFTSNRGINFGNISRTATASPRGYEFNVDPSVSYDYRVKNWIIISPYAGVDYDRLMIDGFTETGADSLDLSVSPETAQTLQSSLGLRFSQKLMAGSTMVVPFASAGWSHEFENQSRPIEAQLVNVGGAPFTVITGEYARDGALLGLGVSGTWSNSISTKLAYNGNFRQHYHDNDLDAIVRWRF